jgi:putative tryptophan/tyrosine transport system substrate-binding protein
MRRREFNSLIGTTLLMPFGAAAQQPDRVRRVPNLGILNYAAAEDTLVHEFRRALSELGHIEGKTLLITYRWADGRFDRLPALAAELVASKVDVIIALGPATAAAKRATNIVPIVIAFSGDPVGNEVVTSLARPGGNITGFSYMSTDLAAKRLQLLSQAFPQNKRIGILYNPAEPATVLELEQTQDAARGIGVVLQLLGTRGPEELNGRFEEAVTQKADALIVFTHGFAVINRKRIIELASSYRLPTMYGWREFVEEGGLMSYGPNVPIMVRKAASYVDRILKGEKPGDLPIEQPARLELIVNLKTAKVAGLEIPPTLVALADAVIE